MKIYFPGLNSLRFLAAFAILIFHIEGFKYTLHLPNIAGLPVIYNIGPLAVSFFFVLSGFLITYLLLVEKETFGKISVKKFYTRRVLRIWPLYYLIIIIGLYAIPNMPFFHFDGYPGNIKDVVKATTPFYFLMLPNVAETLYTVPYIGGTWSIGVEEQFYLFWPWLVSLHRRHFRWLLIIFFSLILIRIFIVMIMNYNVQLFNPLLNFFELLRFDCMAIGALAACLLFYKKKRFLDFIYRRDVQWVSLALIFLLISINTSNWFRFKAWYYILFAIIILNVAAGTKPIIKLRQTWLDYFGKISYGIYMYQPFVIFICLKLLLPTISNKIFFNAALYATSLIGTLIISTISYEGFELFFLRIKKHFVRVKNLEN